MRFRRVKWRVRSRRTLRKTRAQFRRAGPWNHWRFRGAKRRF